MIKAFILSAALAALSLPSALGIAQAEDKHIPTPIPSSDSCVAEESAVADGKSCNFADSLLEKLTPEVVEVYERRISGRPVVSHMDEAWLALASARAGVSEKKFKALALLADLMARTSKPVPVAALAKLGDFELLMLAKKHAGIYLDGLPEEERESLKAEFKAVLK